MSALEGYARYAVYYAPEAGSLLSRLGAAWLGYDAEAGAAAERLETPPTPRPVAEMTADPARYGLHGTVKAPFRLAEGAGVADLDRGLAAFVAEQAPVSAPALEIRADHGFTALRPSGPSPELDALAAAVVKDLDRFRAPLTEAETARRLRAPLTPVQRVHLETWGYPYVLDQFNFHVTLTGRVTAEESATMIALLAPVFAPALEAPFRVRELCLFGDPGERRPFRLLKRYRLGG